MWSKKIGKTALLLCALGAGMSQVGCGSGSKSNTDGMTAVSDTSSLCGVINSSSALLFFWSTDSNCPSTSLVVGAGKDIKTNIFNPGSAWVFPTGSYNSTTKTFAGVAGYAAVYAGTDGKLYKVSALNNNATPTPTQISSQSSAEKICQAVLPSVDYANPGKSQLVYRSAGANGSCDDADDTYKMVRLDLGVSESPVNAKLPVGYALYDWTIGAISGWLVNDAGVLARCDANFANCSPSSTATAGTMSIKNYATQRIVAGTNRSLLEIDHLLYAYDGNANSLSGAVYDMGGAGKFVSLGTNDSSKYFFVTTNAPKSIYAAPLDGSAAAAIVVTDPADVGGIALSTSKLVYWTATKIDTVDKTGTGGPGAVIVTAAKNLAVAALNGDHIYYTRYDSSDVPTAGIIDANGSGNEEIAQSDWIGLVLATSWNLTDGFAAKFQPQTIIRADGYNAQGSGRYFAGATLNAYVAATKASVGALGNLPNDIVRMYCGSFGANSLCNGYNASGLTDIFSLNAETPGSLVRITNTASQNELLLN